mmetsp:Transcript_3856/g.11156  ORF Transcript_3856/g.11156 Transcript_3856/m.11156 type:complete len:256 (-) Transcript_3856:600-1367(-)
MVREVDPLQADLDDVVREALRNYVVPVRAELRGLLGEHRVEALDLALAHGLREPEVAREAVARALLHEHGALRNVTHEQLHEDLELLRLQLEAGRGGRGRLAQRLLQLEVGVAVVQLGRLDAAHVVEVAAELVVAHALREGALVHELVGLVNGVERQVVAQDEVEQHGLPDLVVLQAGGAVRAEEHRADAAVGARLLVREGVVLVRLGPDDVQGAPVVALHVLDDLGRRLGRGVVELLPEQHARDEIVDVNGHLG